MERVLIVCEGPEDLTALRELLSTAWGMKTQRGAGSLAGELRAQRMSHETCSVELRVANGKQDLPRAVREELDRIRNAPGITGLGVCFDPDEQSVEEWHREFFGYPLHPDGSGDHAVDQIRVTPLPWDVVAQQPPPVSNPNQVTLEHLLWTALAGTHAPMKELVTRWLAELQAAPDGIKGLKRNWKTAVRLCHALRMPERDVRDVASQVFGQDAALWDAVEIHLRGCTLWAGMGRLVGAPVV